VYYKNQSTVNEIMDDAIISTVFRLSQKKQNRLSKDFSTIY